VTKKCVIKIEILYNPDETSPKNIKEGLQNIIRKLDIPGAVYVSPVEVEE
jgi:hypothetical protein